MVAIYAASFKQIVSKCLIDGSLSGCRTTIEVDIPGESMSQLFYIGQTYPSPLTPYFRHSFARPLGRRRLQDFLVPSESKKKTIS